MAAAPAGPPTADPAVGPADSPAVGAAHGAEHDDASGGARGKQAEEAAVLAAPAAAAPAGHPAGRPAAPGTGGLVGGGGGGGEPNIIDEAVPADIRAAGCTATTPSPLTVASPGDALSAPLCAGFEAAGGDGGGGDALGGGGGTTIGAAAASALRPAAAGADASSARDAVVNVAADDVASGGARGKRAGATAAFAAPAAAAPARVLAGSPAALHDVIGNSVGCGACQPGGSDTAVLAGDQAAGSTATRPSPSTAAPAREAVGGPRARAAAAVQRRAECKRPTSAWADMGDSDADAPKGAAACSVRTGPRSVGTPGGDATPPQRESEGGDGGRRIG